jgi:dynein heavy chain 1
MVANEVHATTPVALCSVAGFDASYRVDNLVAAAQARCASVAMGSHEAFTLADQAIATAARNGSWVLLRNVHLAPAWLAQLEKRLQSLNANRNFRLFLAMETNPSIPINILRQSRVIMAEPAPGIRANILDSLQGLSPTQLSSGPNEKGRLLFLLAYLHAVLVERLRFCPLGFSKLYEFNESDFDAGSRTIDTWLDSVARGRANVDPASIPFEAIRTTLKETCYGGKIDNESGTSNVTPFDRTKLTWLPDQRLLDSFVDTLFSVSAYDVGFPLAQQTDSDLALLAPEGSSFGAFIEWAKALPEREPPSYLGLPPTSENVIAIAGGKLCWLSLLRSTFNMES